MQKTARINFIIITILVISLFFIIGLDQRNFSLTKITGNFVRDIEFIRGTELNTFFYEPEYNTFYIVIDIKDEKYHVARYYPEMKKWQEVNMYIKGDESFSTELWDLVENSYLYSDKNTDLKQYVKKTYKNSLPKSSYKESYLILIDKKGNEVNYII